MNAREIREAAPVRTLELAELGPVHGVACDRTGRVWFAHGDGGLVAVEPESGRVVRRIEGVSAMSGTTFDGEHLWQITADAIVRLDAETGEVLASIAKPEGVHCSGMAFAEGALWIGDFEGRRLVKIDPATGAVLKRLESDRLVTGVEWVDGELWHGGWVQRERPVDAHLRRLDPETGAVLADVAVGDDWSVSGLAADGEGRFWCGGSHAGGLRAVRRP